MFDTNPAFWIYLTIATYLGVIALKVWANKDIQLRRRIFVASFSTTLAFILAISAYYAIQIVSEKIALQYSFLIIGVTAIVSDSIWMSVLKYPGSINFKTIGNSLFSSSAYYFTSVAIAFIPVIVLWIVTAVLDYFTIWFS